MKNLAKLNGAKALSKNEQKSINGGRPPQCLGSTSQESCSFNDINYVCCDGKCNSHGGCYYF